MKAHLMMSKVENLANSHGGDEDQIFSASRILST